MIVSPNYSMNTCPKATPQFGSAEAGENKGHAVRNALLATAAVGAVAAGGVYAYKTGKLDAAIKAGKDLLEKSGVTKFVADAQAKLAKVDVKAMADTAKAKAAEFVVKAQAKAVELAGAAQAKATEVAAKAKEVAAPYVAKVMKHFA